MMLVCDGGEGNSHKKMEEEACRDESCCWICTTPSASTLIGSGAVQYPTCCITGDNEVRRPEEEEEQEE